MPVGLEEGGKDEKERKRPSISVRDSQHLDMGERR